MCGITGFLDISRATKAKEIYYVSIIELIAGIRLYIILWFIVFVAILYIIIV